MTSRRNPASKTASGVRYAIIAALLLGARTPLAKALLGTANPLLLAGLLYCGSGAGPSRTLASTASLLLNLESVLTALFAWHLFHENFVAVAGAMSPSASASALN